MDVIYCINVIFFYEMHIHMWTMLATFLIVVRKNLREVMVILVQNFSTSWQGSYKGTIRFMAVGVCG